MKYFLPMVLCVVSIAIPGCAGQTSGATLDNVQHAATTAQQAAQVVCRTCRGICAVIDPQPSTPPPIP